jgi:hypothetical protein
VHTSNAIAKAFGRQFYIRVPNAILDVVPEGHALPERCVLQAPSPCAPVTLESRHGGAAAEARAINNRRLA